MGVFEAWWLGGGVCWLLDGWLCSLEIGLVFVIIKLYFLLFGLLYKPVVKQVHCQI